PAPADQPGQQGSVDHRGNAYAHFGHAESRVSSSDPEIAGCGDFQPATEAPAGQAGDHGSRKPANSLAEIAQAAYELLGGLLIQLRHFLDVGAANHALLALAGEDHGADVAIGGQALEPLTDGVGDG